MTRAKDEHQKVRVSHLRWVPLGSLETSLHAQREFRKAWGDALALAFGIEKMGYLVVSHRDDRFFIIGGQHRAYAAKKYGFDDKDTVQCEVYESLTEDEESELFLGRNNFKTVRAFDKFRIAVNAGRETETTVDRIVRTNQLHVAKRSREMGGVSAVGSLLKAYARTDAAALGTTLRVIRDGLGDSGFEASIISGVNLCIHRYNGRVEEEWTVKRLSGINGGAPGLIAEARTIHLSMGSPLDECVGASVTKAYNRGKSGKARLSPWWKQRRESNR